MKKLTADGSTTLASLECQHDTFEAPGCKEDDYSKKLLCNLASRTRHARTLGKATCSNLLTVHFFMIPVTNYSIPYHQIFTLYHRLPFGGIRLKHSLALGTHPKRSLAKCLWLWTRIWPSIPRQVYGRRPAGSKTSDTGTVWRVGVQLSVCVPEGGGGSWFAATAPKFVTIPNRPQKNYNDKNEARRGFIFCLT